MKFGYTLSSEEFGPGDLVRTGVAAGYDHMYFHQIGPDQQAFIEFFQTRLKPFLPSLAH